MGCVVSQCGLGSREKKKQGVQREEEKLNYYFIIKNNNILIKWTRLIFLGMEMLWSITVDCGLLLFT